MQNWKPEQFCKFHLSVKLPSKTCSILLNVKAITEMSRENCPTDLHQRWTAGPIPILAFRAARSQYKRALGVEQPEPQLVSYLEDLQTCWCLRFHTALCGLVLNITWALHCSTSLLHSTYNNILPWGIILYKYSDYFSKTENMLYIHNCTIDKVRDVMPLWKQTWLKSFNNT